MSCIANPDLCPSGQNSETCKEGIQSICGAKKDLDTWLTCIQENAPTLQKNPYNCYDLEKLEDCTACNLLSTSGPPFSDPNLSDFCNKIGQLGPTICEVPGRDYATSCCKWKAASPSPPPSPSPGTTAPVSGKWVGIGILGSLLFVLGIGVLIWLVVRKRSK